MKRLIIWIGSLVAVVAAAIAILLYVFPATVISLTQSQAASAAGLESKTVTIDGYVSHYYEGGTGPTLVLLHGLADDKNSFVNTAASLTDTFHVILPDLRGHGENARDAVLDYSIKGQSDFVANVVDAIGLDTFILGGNSMGGHTSAAFTLAHPDRVEKLILVDAPGLVLDDTVIYSGFGGPIETVEDFKVILGRTMHYPPSLPAPILTYLMKETNAHLDFINGLAEAVVNGADFDLTGRVANIKVPTLVLWGDHDVVVPMNVANGYDALIPQSELMMLTDAGHSPQMEQPVEVAEAILAFLTQ